MPSTLGIVSSNYTPPPLITELKLDASNPNNVTIASGKVSTWLDTSSNNRNFIQTTTGNRPTYNASLSGIEFLNYSNTNRFSLIDGSTDDSYYDTAGPIGFFFVITKYNVPPTGTQARSEFAGNRPPSSGTDGRIFGYNFTGDGSIHCTNIGNGGPSFDVGSSSLFLTRHLVTVISDPATSTFTIAFNNLVSPNAYFAYNNSTTKLNLGFNGHNTWPWAGLIHEVRIYKNPVFYVSAIKQELYTKWNIIP